jgi:NAD(P) transhydrogenase
LWPNPNPPKLDAVKAQKTEAKVHAKETGPVDLFTPTLKTAMSMGAALASIVGLGVLCPDPAFMTMFSTLSLAVIAGY